MEEFGRDWKKEFESSRVNEPFLFEPLRLYCIWTPPYSIIFLIQLYIISALSQLATLLEATTLQNEAITQTPVQNDTAHHLTVQNDIIQQLPAQKNSIQRESVQNDSAHQVAVQDVSSQLAAVQTDFVHQSPVQSVTYQQVPAQTDSTQQITTKDNAAILFPEQSRSAAETKQNCSIVSSEAIKRKLAAQVLSR